MRPPSILLVAFSLGLAACGTGQGAVQSSTDVGNGDPVEVSEPTADPLTLQFVGVLEAAGYSTDVACVSTVVARIPSPDDAARSLRNMTGDTISDADDDLVLSWIEDELEACASIDNGVASTPTAALDDGLSNADVQAGVERLIGGSASDPVVCPFGDIGQFAALAGYAGVFVSTDILVRDDRIRCGARQENIEPSNSVSIDADLDVAGTQSYLADTSFMASLEPFAADGGVITVVCPREQTQGDIPEHCEAFWFADAAALVIRLSVSAAAVSPDAVGSALVAMLPNLKAALAAG